MPQVAAIAVVGGQSSVQATEPTAAARQRGLYCYWRVGAGCVDTGAFGMLNVT